MTVNGFDVWAAAATVNDGFGKGVPVSDARTNARAAGVWAVATAKAHAAAARNAAKEDT